MNMGTEGATATTANDNIDASATQVDEQASAELARRQEEEAGFESGYAGVNAPDAGDAGSDASADPEPEAQPAEPMFGDMTLTQVRAAVEALPKLEAALKAQERLNGTVGNLKQQLEAYRAQPKAAPTALTSESFKRLKADYPDLAEMLASDMSEITLGASQSDPDELARYKAELAEANQRTELQGRKTTAQIIKIMHPDYEQQTATPEFRGYVQALSDEDRNALANSWDVEEIDKHLRAFKEQKTAAEKQAQQKVVKLSKAVTPQGVPVQRGPATMSDEQAMNAGYKAVRG